MASLETFQRKATLAGPVTTVENSVDWLWVILPDRAQKPPVAVESASTVQGTEDAFGNVRAGASRAAGRASTAPALEPMPETVSLPRLLSACART